MYKYYDAKGCSYYTPNFDFAIARARKLGGYIVENPSSQSKLN